MKVFVTGGAGYIGSAASARLLEAGHEITIYDSLVTGHPAAIPEAAEFIEADLGDRETLLTSLKGGGYGAVMHFAAFIEAGESMLQPGKYFENNANNSLWLLEACAQAGVPRVVYSSSAAVYAPNDAPLSEDSKLGPPNVYGQTKLMVEGMLDWYRQAHEIGFVALRYFNAAGALPDRGEAHIPETHLIPLVLRVALGQRDEVRIFGTDYPTPDGSCVRDYIHLADLVSAHLLALEALNPGEQRIYNLGNGAGYSVRDVIEVARNVTGHSIPARETERRPGDPARLVASSDKIRKDLGWSPQHTDLEDIISSAWEWHSSNPHGYR